MKNVSKLLFITLLTLGTLSKASLAPEKIDTEKDQFSILVSPPINFSEGSEAWTKQFITLASQKQEIGKVSFAFFAQNVNKRQIYIDRLAIHDNKYKGQSLGSYLFKYAIAHTQKTYHPTGIYWRATPLDNKSSGQLMKFYSDSGALKFDQHKIINMHYPIPSAHMLAVLLPIFEPTIQTKNDTHITASNGKKINTKAYDVLGIIANYMNPKE